MNSSLHLHTGAEIEENGESLKQGLALIISRMKEKITSGLEQLVTLLDLEKVSNQQTNLGRLKYIPLFIIALAMTDELAAQGSQTFHGLEVGGFTIDGSQFMDGDNGPDGIVFGYNLYHQSNDSHIGFTAHARAAIFGNQETERVGYSGNYGGLGGGLVFNIKDYLPRDRSAGIEVNGGANYVNANAELPSTTKTVKEKGLIPYAGLSILLRYRPNSSNMLALRLFYNYHFGSLQGLNGFSDKQNNDGQRGATVSYNIGG